MKRSTMVSGALCLIAAATGSSLAGGPALGAVSKGGYLGKTEAEIARTLETEGYEVEEFEKERGSIEVEAAIGGVSYEIHVDPKTGEIVGFEVDD